MAEPSETDPGRIRVWWNLPEGLVIELRMWMGERQAETGERLAENDVAADLLWDGLQRRQRAAERRRIRDRDGAGGRV